MLAIILQRGYTLVVTTDAIWADFFGGIMETGIKKARQTLPQLIKMLEQGGLAVLTYRGRKIATIERYRRSRSGPLKSLSDLRDRIKASGKQLSQTIDTAREDRI